MKSESYLEDWETPRRCQKCLAEKNTVYMRAQRWGNGQYRIVCNKCGDFQISEWSGHGVDSLDGWEGLKE